MQYFERNLILCKIKKLTNQEDQHLCYIPELIGFQCAISSIKKEKLPQSLKRKIREIKGYQAQFGIGILPFKLYPAKKFVESLYNELLKNHIPLPANSSESDLKYQIKELSNFTDNLLIYEQKIKIEKNNLTFFAKYLPWIGTVVTYTLTLGFTASALGTVFGWGWSILLFSLFGLCKFLTTYADIAGGPERRLQIFGFWIDRLKSGYYSQHGKFSLIRTLLNVLVVSTLVCSSLSSWYGAWYMIRCMAGISYFPDMVVSGLAGLFAWSNTGSSFGRIYSDLYLLLAKPFSRYICFDNVKDIEKIDLSALSAKLSLQNIQDVIVTQEISVPNTLLHQYQPLTRISDNMENDSPRNFLRHNSIILK